MSGYRRHRLPAEASGVAQHMGMHLDAKISGNAGALYHAAEARRRERCASLG